MAMWDFFDNFFLQEIDAQLKIMIIAVVATVISFTFYSMFTFFWKTVWPKMKRDDKEFEEKIIKEMNEYVDHKIFDHNAQSNTVSKEEIFNKILEINATLANLRVDYAEKMATKEELNELNKNIRESECEIIRIKSHLNL